MKNRELKEKIVEKDELVNLDDLDRYMGLPCVYGLYTAKGTLIRIGSTINLGKRIKEDHMKSLKSNDDDLRRAKELINDDDPMKKSFSFRILAETPKCLETGLQRQFFLSYAETMLIIKHKTYKLANNKSICGDSFIPNEYAIEMMTYYYNKDGNQ